MIALLAHIRALLDPDAGAFALDGPVIVRDGSAWLRISPTESVRWFTSEMEACNG